MAQPHKNKNKKNNSSRTTTTTKKTLTVDESSDGQRIDNFIAKKLGISRGIVQKLISSGKVKVNGVGKIKKSYQLKQGDEVEVEIPPKKKIKIERELAEESQIEIIWEDDDYLVLNKPAGYVVHPSPHHTKKTVVNFILDRIEIKLGKDEFDVDELAEGVLRPGIVHRLDKPVSGVLLVAKNEIALWRASELFKERKVEKKYIALCFGSPGKEKWEISKPIKRAGKSEKVMRVVKKGEEGGKDAITHVRVLRKKSFSVRQDKGKEKQKIDLCLLEVKPITGRTHQIRVHLSSEGFPIVKDEMYGGGGRKLEELRKIVGEFFEFDGIFLHAFSLKIEGKEFKAPLPPYFRGIIEFLWGELPPTLS